MPVLRAILDTWRDDLRWRVSRVKSRMKFMVDALGPEGVRAEVEQRLGYALPSFALPPIDAEPDDHLGVRAQGDGRRSIGVPVHVGLLGGSRLVALGDLLEPLGAEARITRQQNLVLADVPAAEVDAVVAALRDLELPLELNGLRGNGIACTGEPHCNYSVTETKTRLDTLVTGLEERFGDAVAPLRLHLDGCPHACAQHWVGDIGFQGTTARDDEGGRRQAYDIFVRGGVGRDAQIGRSLFRRVPSDGLEAAVEGLVQGWLDGRLEGESFPAFSRRMTDDELGELAGLEPARARVREEAAA
jgi:ferredoxin-nitrite reductase